jgi:uncharacterized membrane protein YgdD (TMEM256/DUF423 family)
MYKPFLISGVIAAGMAVALGAFGAHGLKKTVDAATIETFKTGVQYQFYHALALIITGLFAEKFSAKEIRRAGQSFLGGIILFSGSLYGITAFKTLQSETPKWVGLVTPLGGILFIAGWIFFLSAVLKKK